MNVKRYLNLAKALEKKSIILFGPRQTGKSWLIRNTLQNHKVYNLLHHETFLKFNHSPQRLREEYESRKHDKQSKLIIIDEIQRIPLLLNEVHSMIEEHGVHFLLTGSSARKLRRGRVNLLGGRAHIKHLHPFSFCELKNNFNLERAINYGLLPSVYLSDTPEENLKSYVGLYLKEEIADEGLTRNIPAFSRFLTAAALCNGKIINYTKIANDAQVARSTIQEYFEILKDTLIAHELPAWNKSQKRKPIGTSKFYLFDPGIVRILQDRNLIRINSPEFGETFEAYIFHELKTFADYHQIDKLHYWRSTSGLEVDFILADDTAIEVKASKNVSYQDLKNLKALREEKKLKNYIVVCCEKEKRVVDNIKIIPWRIFLEELWS
jgi:Predicted ATPase (AAA+ superfamily)